MKLNKKQLSELAKANDENLRAKLVNSQSFNSGDIWNFGSIVDTKDGVVIFIPYETIAELWRIK